MICDNCKIDRLNSDFIKNQKFCYRCEYREKVKKTPKKQTAQPKICRICGDKILHEEDLKKHQRKVFCSPECALEGSKIQSNNHWTLKIRLRKDLKWI